MGKKNPHAANLSELGASKGGNARAAKLTPEERKQIARHAAESRWANSGVAKIPSAVYGSAEQPLQIMDIQIPCYVLDDGRRLLVQRALQTGIGMSRSGGSGGEQRLSQFFESLADKGIDCRDLAIRIRNPILFKLPTGGTGYGYEATILPDICDAILEARRREVLLKQQEHFAKQCEILVRGFARVGIIALVDATTGYEKVRARENLEKVLERFVAKELQPWLKTFPDDFYEEIFRLNGWKLSPTANHRPGVVGRWTNDIVYARLAPGILVELQKQTPRGEKGRFKHKLFQKLTPDIGHPKLKEHLSAILALMRIAKNWKQFYQFLDTAFPRYGDTLKLPFDDPHAMERAIPETK